MSPLFLEGVGTVGQLGGVLRDPWLESYPMILRGRHWGLLLWVREAGGHPLVGGHQGKGLGVGRAGQPGPGVAAKPSPSCVTTLPLRLCGPLSPAVRWGKMTVMRKH